MASESKSKQRLGGVVLVAITTLAGSVAAQRSWTPPRTVDGHPSLEGVWEHNSATPLERPAQLAGKPRLTDEELTAMKRRAREVFSPESDAGFGDRYYLTLLGPTPNRGSLGTGTYSQNWLPEREFEHRTSLIVDPADGRLPPMTPQGEQVRRAFAAKMQRRPTSAEEMTLTDRCISYGFPDLFAGYMSVYRITQTSDAVAIQMEKIHDVRIIPLDGRPHLPASMRQYLGDSRGRWEGDTLVVDTTNFDPRGNQMGGYLALSDQNLHLTERLRRTAADTLEYTFTVDDPTMWVRPWTATINWKQSRGEVLEYACHEGNYSLRGMLSAARVEESR